MLLCKNHGKSKNYCARPRGALVKFELGGPCIMQNNLLFYTKCSWSFSVRPPLTLVIFVHAPPPVPCKNCCPPPFKKLQMEPLDIYKHLGSFALFRLGYYLFSLAVLFHRTCPKISSGRAPQTFVLTVSFGVWQNQRKLEAEWKSITLRKSGDMLPRKSFKNLIAIYVMCCKCKLQS